MSRGFAFPSLLIVGVFIFFADVVIDNAIERTGRDEFIGASQLEAVSKVQDLLFEQQQFEQEMRVAFWDELRGNKPVRCNAYYGRPMQGCSFFDKEVDLSWNGKPVRHTSFLVDKGVQVVVSSGEHRKIEEHIPVGSEAYLFRAGTFVDASFVLPIPSQKIINELLESAEGCAVGVPVSVCPGRAENEDWVAEAVEPFEGLEPREKYRLYMVEQIQQCAEHTGCKCPLDFPDANILGIEEEMFVEQVAREGNKVVLGLEGIQLGDATIALENILRYNDGGDHFVDAIEFVPGVQLLRWKRGAEEGAFTPTEFVVVNEGFTFYKRGIVVNVPECQLEREKYVFKLTSKRLFPPNASPLQLFVAGKIS